MTDRLRSAWIACALVGQGLCAQSTALPIDFEDFRTPDGSRFILVPTGGPPVIHWVMATPAGVLEDPVGMEGLSFAVARSAMAGTGSTSSLDWEAESRILAEQDRVEQEWDRLLSNGEEVPPDLAQQLETYRAQASALTDPIAWERRLRIAPALGTRLSQIPEANLLHVTTSVEGLPRVAMLLLEQREGLVLRDIHVQFRAVRAEQTEQRGLGTVGEMRREVLGMSFLGHDFARAYAATDQPRPLSRDTALELYRRTHHPERTLHVLTGGFSIQVLQEQLERIFAVTAIPPPHTIQKPEPADGVGRASTIRGIGPTRLAIGFRIPPETSEDAVAVLVRWLTDGLDAEIVARLRERGHTDAVVTGTAPFPLRSANLLLLEIEDPTPRAPNLLQSLGLALEQIMKEGPSEEEVTKALARARSAVAASQMGAQNLAYELAVACAVDGKLPIDVLMPAAQNITQQAIQQLAVRSLSLRKAAVVRLEVPQ